MFFVIFIVIKDFGKFFIPSALQEVIVAYSLLLLGISLSSNLKSNIVRSLGVCSFGIYLIHPFLMNIVKTFVSVVAHQFTEEVTIISMLILSLPTFFISWLVVSLLSRNKLIAKYIFGT